jgi:hypothetical protein
MKKLLLLSAFLLAPVFDGESFGFLNQAVAAGVSREGPEARLERAYGIEQRIKTRDKYQSNEKRLLTAHGPTNEIDAKRLKLIFLLILSQGQYRVPVY